MRIAFVVGVLALMALGLLIVPDRSARLAHQLVEHERLYTLAAEERANLNSFLDALAETSGITKPFAINEPYDPDRINLYIVELGIDSESEFPHGNAAYASQSDIIFIDAAYFRHGSERIMADTDDSLTASVLAPLQVHVFFVLAHELGHRQRHTSLLPASLFGTVYNHKREIEADDFAIAALISLYATEERREAAAIPGPVSSLLGMFSDGPTALQRFSDHLGFAVNFLSDEIFGNPFPLLSQSATHPAFFSRMTRLLDQLIKKAEEEQDEEALRQLMMSKNIAEATASLLRLRPIEIEFANAFQFAFLDKTTLYVFGSDDEKVIMRPLSELKPGTLVRMAGPSPNRRPTVRYAWPGEEGKTLLMRRDGKLQVVETASGAVLSDRSLEGAFGDNSCVKRVIFPPAPAELVYVYYCSEGTDHAALIDNTGTITRINLEELARGVLGMTGGQQERSASASVVRIAGFDLNAQGGPTLHFVAHDRLYSASLSPMLKVLNATPLRLDPNRLSKPMFFRGARITPSEIVVDGAGHSYFLAGSDIFREIALYSAYSQSPKPVAEIDLTPSTDAPRLAQVLPIRDSYQLTGNRLIVNLVAGGAYLIDFDARRLVPLNRQGFSEMEQILSNMHGDWILYRKYSTRILLFKGGDE